MNKTENTTEFEFSKQFLLKNLCFPKDFRQAIKNGKAKKMAEKQFKEEQKKILEEAVESLKNVSFPNIPNARFPIQEAIAVEWLNSLSHKEEFEKMFFIIFAKTLTMLGET